MELGFLSLGELQPNAATGELISPQQRLDEILRAGQLADDLGLDVFGVGEHHKRSYVLSAPTTVLGALAAKTQKIRLTTASTDMPNLHPVRVAEDFATLDLLSGGRIEIIAGKGNFQHVFPLLGQRIEDQRPLHEEHVTLLVQAWNEETINWRSQYWPETAEGDVWPRPLQKRPPIWCGASSGFYSSELAAKFGLGLILGGVISPLEHYAQIADHYRERWAFYGRPEDEARIATVSHLHLKPDSTAAKHYWKQYYLQYFREGAKLAGQIIPAFDFDERVGPKGPVMCGSPAEIIDKLGVYHARLKHHRHFFQADIAGLPWTELAHLMEFFTSDVAPSLRLL